MTTFRKLWADDAGYGAITFEWLFLVLVLVIGLVTGWVAVRQALLSELIETAQTIMSLNQTYSFSGQSNSEALTSGSSAYDQANTMRNGSTQAPFAVIDQTPCD